MKFSADTIDPAMSEVSALQRNQIAAGMRWTVWLAAVAFPLSYATSTLIARISPEAIGTYALLTVYTAVITAFCYFGGDTVVIRFMPRIEAIHRIAFLSTYYLLSCAIVAVWFILAGLFPAPLRHLMGEHGGPRFRLLLFALAPVPIAFSMSTAALKGLLEIRIAQTLSRVLTIGSFVFYSTVSVLAANWLSRYYTEIIWGTYLSLAAAAALAACTLLKRRTRTNTACSLRLYVPPGFWRYAFHTQQVGVVWFLIQRMDVIVVLNVAGLSRLGKYAAGLAIASLVPTVNTFFTDTLLPALSNLIEAGNLVAAHSVFRMQMRINMAMNAGFTCVLLVCARPLVQMLGARYRDLEVLVVLMVSFYGIAAPGFVGGTVLAAVGRQYRATWVGVAQVGLFALLFAALWPRWEIAGAVVATGVAVVVANTTLLVIAGLDFPMDGIIFRPYLCSSGMIALLCACSLAALPAPILEIAGVLGFGGFLWFSGYRMAECRHWVQLFVPIYAGSRFLDSPKKGSVS